MKVIQVESADQDIARRLVTAVVSHWAKLPPDIQQLLLNEASLAFDARTQTTGLHAQIKAFIAKHQEAKA
jgi:hypothetical protein